MKNHQYSFIKINKQRNQGLLIPKNVVYYLVIHFKLASLFHTTQLVDIFTYEFPNFSTQQSDKSVNNIVIYNFHSFLYQNRLFLFCNNTKFNIFKSKNNFPLNSITELFYSANWLEKENSELHGVNFLGKKDLRNLLLPYGDNSFPFQKSFPSLGLKEIFYDSIKDTLIQSNLNSQI